MEIQSKFPIRPLAFGAASVFEVLFIYLIYLSRERRFNLELDLLDKTAADPQLQQLKFHRHVIQNNLFLQSSHHDAVASYSSLFVNSINAGCIRSKF